MNTAACDPMIEDYFSELEAKMSDLPAADRQEFTRELRAHVLDRLEQIAVASEADCRSVLKALGTPEEIARQYRLERIMSRSAWRTSPLAILRTTSRWALTGVQGFVVFMIAFTGYAFAAGFYLGALLKPFFPRNVGFFVGRQGLNLAAWPEPQGVAVLDSYFIPLSVLLGFLFTLGTGAHSLHHATSWKVEAEDLKVPLLHLRQSIPGSPEFRHLLGRAQRDAGKGVQRREGPADPHIVFRKVVD